MSILVILRSIFLRSAKKWTAYTEYGVSTAEEARQVFELIRQAILYNLTNLSAESTETAPIQKAAHAETRPIKLTHLFVFYNLMVFIDLHVFGWPIY